MKVFALTSFCLKLCERNRLWAYLCETLAQDWFFPSRLVLLLSLGGFVRLGSWRWRMRREARQVGYFASPWTSRKYLLRKKGCSIPLLREEHKVGFQWITGEENGLLDQTGLSSNLHSTIYGLCAPNLWFLVSLLYIFHEGRRLCMRNIQYSTLHVINFHNVFYCYYNIQSENIVSAAWIIQHSPVFLRCLKEACGIYQWTK